MLQARPVVGKRKNVYMLRSMTRQCTFGQLGMTGFVVYQYNNLFESLICHLNYSVDGPFIPICYSMRTVECTQKHFINYAGEFAINTQQLHTWIFFYAGIGPQSHCHDPIKRQICGTERKVEEKEGDTGQGTQIVEYPLHYYICQYIVTKLDSNHSKQFI